MELTGFAVLHARDTPLLLSRHIIAQADFVTIAVEDLEIPCSYVLVTPAYGEPTGNVRELADRINRTAALWLR